MNIGIIGLGSIGRRHAEVLKKLKVENIYALRSNKGSLKELPDNLAYIKQVFNKEDFIQKKLDAIIICTPTSEHFTNLLDVLQLNIPILIEKPLSDNLDYLPDLKKEQEEKIKVAFCLRHHAISMKIKSLIKSLQYGNVLKATLQVGQYLPTWHPYTDYRHEYFSKKELGGGALRTLSHELDLAQYWFGEFKNYTASVSKISQLEIDVDDNVFMIGQHPKNVVTNINIDFLAARLRRNGIITFDNGELEFDYIGNTLTFFGHDNYLNETFHIPKEDIYYNQAQDFLQFIKANNTNCCNFDQAKKIMHVIINAEKASNNKIWI